MPAKSKAQQRYMAIAEHDPSALRGPMPNMTHQQLHDFAATPVKSKPEHVGGRRTMHPAMQERAGMVREAHQHLSETIPNFKRLPIRQQGLAVQEHVRTRKANGY